LRLEVPSWSRCIEQESHVDSNGGELLVVRRFIEVVRHLELAFECAELLGADDRFDGREMGGQLPARAMITSFPAAT
jgi:hypothetical protein